MGEPVLMAKDGPVLRKGKKVISAGHGPGQIPLLMILPVVIYFFVFRYLPIGGILMAFIDFNPLVGIIKSPWLKNYGMQKFIDFFTGPYFYRIVKSTIVLNEYALLFKFPVPIRSPF